MSGIEKMDLESKDLVAEHIKQLKALFPEIATEGRLPSESKESSTPPPSSKIDFEKLRLILGDEVDEGQERYAFTWPGKANAIRQAQTPSTATLRPDEIDSVDWDTTENLYIEGDNLEVLKLLQRGYHGKVKMIYIDPPYNTGHDFVYKDSFQDSIENYKEQAGLSGQSNVDTSGRYHSDWLSMMYPRLRLARELLSEDGVVFISIDDNEQKNLKELCDEIFGENCFLASFVWQKRTSPDMRKVISAAHEYILAYTRTPECRTSLNQLPYSEEDLQRYKNPDNDPNGPWISTDCTAQAGHGTAAQFYDMVTPSGRVVKLGSGLCWRYTQEKMNEEIEAGHIWFGADGNGVPRKKTYLKDMSGKNGWTWLPHSEVGHTQEATKEIKALFDGELPFDYPKPTRLMKRLLQLGTNKDSLVLDFFSGSATTADAIIQLNASDEGERRFILIQLPENNEKTSEPLTDTGEKRIQLVGNKVKAEIEEENNQLKLGEEPKPVPDIGFRVLKLDSSNFERVADGALIDNLIKPGRTHDDIIFEMMLKWGLELSLPMEKTEVAGYPITSIAADELICCMDEGPTVEILEAIAALEPKRVFFLDSILTDTIKLNAAQIFKRVGDKLGYEIELRTA